MNNILIVYFTFESLSHFKKNRPSYLWETKNTLVRSIETFTHISKSGILSKFALFHYFCSDEIVAWNPITGERWGELCEFKQHAVLEYLRTSFSMHIAFSLNYSLCPLPHNYIIFSFFIVHPFLIVKFIDEYTDEKISFYLLTWKKSNDIIALIFSEVLSSNDFKL